VLFAGPLSAAFTRLASQRLPELTAQKLAKLWEEYVLLTLAALVTALLVIFYHFRRLSLTTLIANPLVMPVQPPVMILGGLAVLLGLVYYPLGQLVVLEVSEGSKSGDAILITTPEGRHLLIDSGPYASLLSDALGRRLTLGNRELDWLVIGGVEEAQLGALPRVIERFPPQNVLWAGPERGTRWAVNLSEALVSAGIPLTQAKRGHALDLGRGAVLEVLQAGSRGAVLLLEWGNFRVLLPIGIGFDELEALQFAKGIGSVNALLLADNGYAPSNPKEWIDNLSPEIVLLSVSGKDSQGLPSPETLEALEGRTLLRTDQNGWIEITTDGERMWVEVERK
jgi:beta-lactamase superfamily II metal-dependent hydrolase